MNKKEQVKTATPYGILAVVLLIIMLVLSLQGGTVNKLTTGELLKAISDNKITEKYLQFLKQGQLSNQSSLIHLQAFLSQK